MSKFDIKAFFRECKQGAKVVLKYYLWVIILLFLLDIGSKHLMNYILKSPGNSIVVIPGFFSFTLVYNTGAAWGMFGGQTWLLVSMSVICGIAMVFALLYIGRKSSKMPKIALAMMIPGAFGNLIDRAFYSKGVIDFLQFTFINFPVFNLADSYLVIGIIVLVIYYIIVEVKEIKNKDKKETTSKEVDLNSAKNKLVNNVEQKTNIEETPKTEENKEEIKEEKHEDE